ncbi:MAG: carbon monoxide dehydrogenase [Euryarchaeota archaeon]|nr:carbon monoxide dehydrogenase [Euryarchaeota archaeon]
MTTTLAVAGKGGVGKSTLAALLVHLLSSKKKLLLAVDADPNTNLDEKLGVKADTSVGAIREDLSKTMDSLPAGISKPEFITLRIQQAITEGDGFDLLVMGRQEGPGCYCYVNNLLRTILDNIARKYAFVVIDNEAGMEHLSRRTTRNVDVMFILSDPTRTGIMTAVRIKKLAEEMKLGVGKFVLVVNRSGGLPGSLGELASGGGFASLEPIPEDEALCQISEKGLSVADLPPSSPFRKAVERMVSSYT